MGFKTGFLRILLIKDEIQRYARSTIKNSHVLSIRRNLEIFQPPQNISQYAREANLEIQNPCQIYFTKKFSAGATIRIAFESLLPFGSGKPTKLMILFKVE